MKIVHELEKGNIKIKIKKKKIIIIIIIIIIFKNIEIVVKHSAIA